MLLMFLWKLEKPSSLSRSTSRHFYLGIILTILFLREHHASPQQGDLLTTGPEYGRRLKVALPANGIGGATSTTRRPKHSNGLRHSGLHFSGLRNDINHTTRLMDLVAGVDTAVARLVDHVRSSNESQHLFPETLSLLKQVDDALESTTPSPQPSQINITIQGAAKLSARYPDYRLSKERIQSIAAERDGVVMVTWANFNYLDFVQNWILHLKQINVTTYMIGTIDEKLFKALIAIGEKNVFVMDPIVKGEDVSFGSSEFIAMGRQHCLLIEELTGLGVDVLVSDIDSVWLRDPFPYLARYPAADILVTSDALHNSSNTDALETYSGLENIGIVLFRKTAHEFAKELSYRLANDDNLWEQHALVELINRNASQYEARKDRLFRGYNGSYLIGTLPVALFASGHTYYTQNLAELMGIGPPFVVHNTYQFSGTHGKRHRFRERHLWLVDPDEYYDPPGGLLSFDLHVEGFLEPASHLDLQKSELDDFMPHFQLVNHQLQQLRNAVAFAVVLNRTLVLPHFWSGSDRWWAPFHGIVPGSQVKHLPRQVPSDYLLELEPMSYGLDFRFREYSFLNNSRLPAQTLEHAAHVTICQEKDRSCHNARHVGQRLHKQVRVKAGLMDEEIVTIFKAHEAVKLLHFSDMRNSFGGFKSEALAKRFEEHTQSYPSIFCCVDAHPGHVWYDMWWDKEDHVNRHGELVHRWKPTFGP